MEGPAVVTSSVPNRKERVSQGSNGHARAFFKPARESPSEIKVDLPSSDPSGLCKSMEERISSPSLVGVDRALVSSFSGDLGGMTTAISAIVCSNVCKADFQALVSVSTLPGSLLAKVFFL